MEDKEKGKRSPALGQNEKARTKKADGGGKENLAQE